MRRSKTIVLMALEIVREVPFIRNAIYRLSVYPLIMLDVWCITCSCIQVLFVGVSEFWLSS